MRIWAVWGQSIHQQILQILLINVMIYNIKTSRRSIDRWNKNAILSEY